MSSNDYEVHGAVFSEHIRLYREDLRASAGSAAARLADAREAWTQVCCTTPSGEPRLSEDFYLFYAFMVAVDVGRSDEAERLYDLMSSEIRERIDLIEDKNPGQAKIWLNER
ncbi:MAG: hypothetical protein KF850_01855 [Labilithrix sp.]|nr:hypothetical protein [Labilithrix sp.]